MATNYSNVTTATITGNVLGPVPVYQNMTLTSQSGGVNTNTLTVGDGNHNIGLQAVTGILGNTITLGNGSAATTVVTSVSSHGGCNYHHSSCHYSDYHHSRGGCDSSYRYCNNNDNHQQGCYSYHNCNFDNHCGHSCSGSSTSTTTTTVIGSTITLQTTGGDITGNSITAGTGSHNVVFTDSGSHAGIVSSNVVYMGAGDNTINLSSDGHGNAVMGNAILLGDGHGSVTMTTTAGAIFQNAILLGLNDPQHTSTVSFNSALDITQNVVAASGYVTLDFVTKNGDISTNAIAAVTGPTNITFTAKGYNAQIHDNVVGLGTGAGNVQFSSPGDITNNWITGGDGSKVINLVANGSISTVVQSSSGCGGYSTSTVTTVGSVAADIVNNSINLTGAGNDTVTLYAAGTNGKNGHVDGNTISLDAGNDFIQIKGAEFSNNILTGGAGKDTFDFANTVATTTLHSNSSITDFTHGQDVIKLEGFAAHSYSALGLAQDSGTPANTIVTIDAFHTLTLVGVNHSTLTASDFSFA